MKTYLDLCENWATARRDLGASLAFSQNIVWPHTICLIIILRLLFVASATSSSPHGDDDLSVWIYISCKLPFENNNNKQKCRRVERRAHTILLLARRSFDHGICGWRCTFGIGFYIALRGWQQNKREKDRETKSTKKNMAAKNGGGAKHR